MDSPLILCNIQKCALEQVQAAVEQFGHSDTKHFIISQILTFVSFFQKTLDISFHPCYHTKV